MLEMPETNLARLGKKLLVNSTVPRVVCIRSLNKAVKGLPCGEWGFSGLWI